MIGLNTLFTGGVAGFLDFDAIDVIDDVVLDGGVDYSPTYSYNIYDIFDKAFVSTLSQGKESTLYAKDFTDFGDFYRLVINDGGIISNINRGQKIFKQESTATFLCSCDSGKSSTLYVYTK